MSPSAHKSRKWLMRNNKILLKSRFAWPNNDLACAITHDAFNDQFATSAIIRRIDIAAPRKVKGRGARTGYIINVAGEGSNFFFSGAEVGRWLCTHALTSNHVFENHVDKHS